MVSTPFARGSFGGTSPYCSRFAAMKSRPAIRALTRRCASFVIVATLSTDASGLAART
jgi:hypothetical protein